MHSTTSQIFPIGRLWKEIGAAKGEAPEAYRYMFENAFYNLPVFLQEFCYLYYARHMSLEQTADCLGISISLAKQRRVVSIAMFRILLASKPKGPV